MTSRDKILTAIRQNQPALNALPVIENYQPAQTDLVEKFTAVLQSIGGAVYKTGAIDEMIALLQQQFGPQARILTLIPEFSPYAIFYDKNEDPHLLADVDVAIIKAHFAVAENGAVWVTDHLLQSRVLPFICQHLVVAVDAASIVATMHDAYDKISDSAYGFGTFIAGPSKTADIEQSLVLGAHGPKTMTLFLKN